MATTIYFTYRDDTKAIASRHLSQLQANNAAVDGVTTALTGGQTVARRHDGTDVDAMLAEADGIWSVHAGQTPTVQQKRYNPYPGRAAVEEMHERYEDLWHLLHRLGPSYPPEDVQAIDALLFALHGGVYLVFTSDLTQTQKLHWLSQQALGFADSGYDPENPVSIAPLIDAIPINQRRTTGAMFVASPGPTVVSGMAALGTRLTLRDCFKNRNQSSADDKPTVTQLGGGAWIHTRIMF